MKIRDIVDEDDERNLRHLWPAAASVCQLYPHRFCERDGRPEWDGAWYWKRPWFDWHSNMD
ncbi:hypothetical protein DL93DRAFT_2074610 [Clavulina sp. PMI_390]|nr:hypothetical protein DL93DRAFT_2074610 [Clavulina sp. PMI_390]